ncbi:thiamine pyrophosphate-dependent dehydrogenase E1 component subunit alpha [Sneathiella glossodoripedis]|uniref:thiamine pyrophosphate-dependent dehydrogenase E1 component subunit alpha n=1 Tax=Sneathiella glossodoripedis TaxID=418853 RepID=UPI00046E914C|nr:thiamine pyrophosphate-dependent dehydrogenase E1 component subunit alpha [Sneathiella glossodoripedis]
MNKLLAQKLSHSMRRIRTVEETIAERYSEQQMRCPTHLSTGQEAVSAAVGEILRKTDLAVSGHRAHAHYLAKGGNLNAMIAEIYGRVTGCARGKGGSMHLIDESVGFMGSTAIVGGTVPVGVGLGYGLKLKGEQNIAVIFLGDAVVETGVFYESINFALLKNLPVLFVCENNQFSVYTPLEQRQSTTLDIYERVAGLGVMTEYGNGNDVVEVYNKTKNMTEKIRSGGGPAFLQFDTFRWREHCGPNYDDDLNYRETSFIEKWRSDEPIARFEKYAIDTGLLKETEIQTNQIEIEAEVNAAFEFAVNSPFPHADEASKHVFAEQHIKG